MKQIINELRLLVCDRLLHLILHICPKNDEGFILIHGIKLYYQKIIDYNRKLAEVKK